jgi:hypothetical protein
VLGLGEKVRGDPGRIVVAVRDHHDLRGARHHVDADLAIDLALCRGDIGVAGADDLGDGRDGFGAVGERGDGLCPADPIDLVHAGKLGRHQHQRVEHTLWRRHGHDDAGNARDLRRKRVHQH